MAEGGEAHTGWIYDPLTDRFCVAHRGKGAFINGEKVTARPTGETPPVAAISLIFMDPARREAVQRARSRRITAQVDVPCCAAEQYPRLALGVNDVSIFERTLPWDHAAGVLFAQRSGRQRRAARRFGLSRRRLAAQGPDRRGEPGRLIAERVRFRRRSELLRVRGNCPDCSLRRSG